jgi:hypothetical protein
VSGQLKCRPQESVLYLLYGVHYILDGCFWLRLEKVDDSLEKVVNRIIKSRIEGTYGGERVGCFMLESNFRIFARGYANLFNEIN